MRLKQIKRVVDYFTDFDYFDLNLDGVRKGKICLLLLTNSELSGIKIFCNLKLLIKIYNTTCINVHYIPRYNNEAIELVPSLLEITSLPNNSQCNLE